MKNFLSLIFVLFVANAAIAQKGKVEDILPFDGGIYILVNEGASSWSKQSKLQKKSLKAIEAFAERRNKGFEIVEIKFNEGPFILGVYPRVDIKFKLVEY